MRNYKKPSPQPSPKGRGGYLNINKQKICVVFLLSASRFDTKK